MPIYVINTQIGFLSFVPGRLDTAGFTGSLRFLAFLRDFDADRGKRRRVFVNDVRFDLLANVVGKVRQRSAQLTPPAIVPTLSGMTRIGTIEIRVTPEERTAIRALAKADNRTVSDWVRLTLLRTIIPGEPMKLTVTQIREATLVVSQIIREARPMPQRGKLRLARLHMKLLPEFTTIEAQRDALIQEHGVPALDPVTNEPMLDKWMVPPENMADFNAAWAAIADDEIDVDVTPIPMADLDTGTGNGGIEANELIILGELIAE